MALVVVHGAPAAAWDKDLMKQTICDSVDNGIDRAEPVANMVAKAGVSACVDKTGNCSSALIKRTVTPYVSENNAPAANVVVDACTNSAVTKTKSLAAPMVDSCTQSTSGVAKGAMHVVVNSTVDFSYYCYNRIAALLT
ncbi:MAG: hypothetical protein ABSA17_00830 [Rhabdochlamydiaceae bacterium]|jgi:hypothetical protein